MQEVGRGPLTEQLNLATLVRGLIEDLNDLRSGRISVREAHARAELARQILRGVHYVVTAQKFIESQALPAAHDGASRNR